MTDVVVIEQPQAGMPQLLTSQLHQRQLCIAQHSLSTVNVMEAWVTCLDRMTCHLNWEQ